jgi:hypothetical protein
VAEVLMHGQKAIVGRLTDPDHHAIEQKGGMEQALADLLHFFRQNIPVERLQATQ